MAWKKYFRTVNNSGNLSPMSNASHDPATPSFGMRNYQSRLPDVYVGHPNRTQRISQYNQMDSDNEVNAALDIIAEFCTQVNTDNFTAFDVHYNEPPTDNEISIIKEQLNQWHKLNEFEKRMFKIFRNTIKNGDQVFIRDPETFKLFYVDPTKVTKVIVNESDGKKPEQYVIKDINPNFENLTVTAVSTSDSYMNHPQVGGPTGSYTPTVGSGTGGATRFGNSRAEAVINAEHILHLSLSEGLDEFWPFGTSILETVFKVFKQKELLEDAILIYRIQRAPERRVFKIDVGNMPTHLAMAFVERVKNEVHQRRIPSQSGGGCFDMNTKVPLLDGRTLSLNELTGEFNAGKQNWAYSCNPETGEMVPGLITWAGVTQKSAKVIKLTLDNGETIICTPEHKFPILGKGKTEAKDIIVNEDSLISFNSRLHDLSNKEINVATAPQYHQVFNHKTKQWEYTHRTVAHFVKNKGIVNELSYGKNMVSAKKDVIHHIDFNKHNNEPNNLFFMNWRDHFWLHSDLSKLFHSSRNQEEKNRTSELMSAKQKNRWQLLKDSDPDYIANHVNVFKNQANQWNQELFDIVIDTINNCTGVRSESGVLAALNANQEFMELYRSLNQPLADTVYKLQINEFTITTFRALVRSYGFATWKKLIRSMGYNIQKPSRKLVWDQCMVKMLADTATRTGIVYRDELCNEMLKNADFMAKYYELNQNIKGNASTTKFTPSTLTVMLNHFGYDHWSDFKDKLPLFNHKVVSMEWLDNEIEVGTLTIDGNEKYHNYHTFAIEQGVYTLNSSMIDATYNPMCLDLSTRIPLLDNRTLTLAELITEYEAGKINWAYSCDPVTGEIMPGIISWAGITKRNTEVIKLTFDNGKTLICTPTHKIPVLGKGFIEAKDLTTEDSLIAYPVNEPQHIKSIEFEFGMMDVGTLTIDQEEKYHAHHTFAIESGIFVKNSMNEDFFFPQTCLKLDTKVKLLDNRDVTLEELIADYEAGKENWTYSVNPTTKKIEPGKIVWAGVTRKQAQVVKVTLDSGESVTCTPDHRFIMSDGSEVEAKDLSKSDSMMLANLLYAYNVISIEWLTELVDTGDLTIESESNAHNFSLSCGIFVHNSEGRGSSVEILPGGCFAMDTKVSLLDGRELSIAEIKQEMDTGKELWTYSCEPKTGKVVPGLISWAGVTHKSAKVMKLTLDNGETITCTPEHKFPVYGEDLKMACEFQIGDSLIPLNKCDKYNLSDYKEHDISEQVINKVHIKAIDYLPDEIEVGTLTIDQDEIHHNYHSFALTVGVFVMNSGLGEITDLRFFTNKLFRGLRIPSSYLPTQLDEAANSYSDGKVGIAMIQEWRFNQYCKRLQNLIVEPLDREFKLFMRYRGINIDNSVFNLVFNEPQNFTKYRQAEIDQVRIGTFTQLEQFPYMSKRFLMTRYLGLSEEEMQENEAMWAEEHTEAESSPEAANLRSVGVSAGGIMSDMTNVAPPGGDMEGGMGDMGGEGGAPGGDMGGGPEMGGGAPGAGAPGGEM